jgi:hypothetical protein
LCEAEEVPLAGYFAGVEALMPLLQHTASAAGEMVGAREYAGNQCQLDVHLAAIFEGQLRPE